MGRDTFTNNDYEEIRRQRMEENKKKLEDLGIAKISGSLLKLYKSKKKKARHRLSKPREKFVYTIQPRRSSRVRNEVPSYREDVDINIPASKRRSTSDSISWASYLARPLHECRSASCEERAEAFRVAEEFQGNLRSGNPSFVKSMVRSHVYSCFWLGLPTTFCVEHLSKQTYEIVLEDEEGQEYCSTFIGKRTGLSGGWRGFALDHKLDDGDALVFELTEATRFKVYVFRVSSLKNRERDLLCSKGSQEHGGRATSSMKLGAELNGDEEKKDQRWSGTGPSEIESAGDKRRSNRLKSKRKA